jgi:hypothetical protein
MIRFNGQHGIIVNFILFAYCTVLSPLSTARTAPKQSKAKQSKAKQSKAKQSKTKQNKTRIKEKEKKRDLV